jgi:hypothetical protein
MPVVIVAGPFIGDEQKSLFTEIEFGKNEFEKETPTQTVFLVIFFGDAAFSDDFEIVEENRAGADVDVFESFYFWCFAMLNLIIFKNIKFWVCFIKIFWLRVSVINSL